MVQNGKTKYILFATAFAKKQTKSYVFSLEYTCYVSRERASLYLYSISHCFVSRYDDRIVKCQIKTTDGCDRESVASFV